MQDEGERAVIVEGYTRERHWEIVYHDLIDLYGPKIGLDGIGLWITYKRFIQHNPDHLLTDKAWPSHRGLLAPLFKVGQTKLRNARQSLADAGLIEVVKGRDLARRSQEEYDQQLLIWHDQGKPRKPVSRITLSDLADLGIQNPSRTIFIEVNDPLTFHAFCDYFELAYSPDSTSLDSQGRPVWNMRFEDYSGLIRGPNRLLAAARYIEDNLKAHAAERHASSLVTEQQVRSLLRCRSDDQETQSIRDRLLDWRYSLVDGDDLVGNGLPPRDVLPAEVLSKLDRLGWKGSFLEVEKHFHRDPDRVYEQLNYWLEHRGEVDNAAAAFRESLRYAPTDPPSLDEWQEMDF